MRDIDSGKDVNGMNDRNDMSGAAEAPGAKGISPARKWIGIGVLAAGVGLAGISFNIIQSRAIAGDSGAPRSEIPGGAVETGARQSASTRVASRGGCGQSASRGGCGQTASRGCCSTSSTSGGAAAQPGALQLDPRLSFDQSRERIVEYYAKELGGPVTVEIKDFGCHQEAEVLKDGKLVKRLSISGGAVNEIG